ncbi:hypothetical protein ACFW04_002041 [Cataglyphis niger]
MNHCKSFVDQQTIEVEMVVPPDGGWGWVIVAASFMCNLFVDGIIFSFGVFLNEIADAFSISKARVALVGSLQTGFYLMAGPFVSALANRYGFRLVAILGSVISCIAFVLSYFSTSIEFLYVSYGAIGGIGAGLIYVPAVITTGFYFERWRALATGIAVCGSGIGAFLLAPISDILIKNFGWRGALLFQAGMLLNCAIFGAMFRPLKPTRIKVKNTPENAALEVKTALMGKGVSTTSLHCVPPNRSGFFGTNNNTEYPTAAELFGNRAIKANIDASTAMFLVSVIGIGNTIGRIVCGLASSLPGVNALVVNNMFISVGGLVTILSGISLTEGYQFFYAASFGLSISVFASLRSILVVDLLGLEKLTNAFGLLLLFQGVAATVGAPLAGAFMDATGSYDASFYLSGSLILVSAVICYPLKRINMWERRGEKNPVAMDLSAS